MAKKKLTRKSYERYLNSISPEQGSEEWIIGGKIRMLDMNLQTFGRAIRKYDPIGFEAGYQDYIR
jgi:hypothetical protein